MSRGRYRSKEGNYDYYSFSYERQSNGEIRTYIEEQPSYRNRDSGGHASHRYTDGSRHYICWSEPVRDINQAVEISKAWADKTSRYIKTGRGF